MSSPGRELHRQRASPAAEAAAAEASPVKAAPAEVQPVSQSSGTSVIEPTPRPAAGASSGPSTPGVSSTAQACVRTPPSRRRPDASPADQRAATAGGDRRGDRRGPAEKRQQQERRAQDVAASTDSEAQRHGDLMTEEEQEEHEEEDGAQPHEEDHQPQPEDEDGSEIQDDDEQQASDEDRRDEEGELQINESEQEGEEDDFQKTASEDEPEPEPEMSQKLHQKKRNKQRGPEHESHEDAGTKDQHAERKNKKSRPAPPPEQPQSSPDFEPSPRASEPTSAAEQSPPPAVPVPATAAASRPAAAGRASKQADRSVASIESRQRASRRPRAATRPTYVEIESSPGDNGEQDSQSSSPSRPEPQRRQAARDLNNNTTTAPAAEEEEDEVSWFEDRHGSRDPEPAVEPPRHAERAAPAAREKKQAGKAAAGKAARGKQAQSSAPAGKRQKPRPSVSFQEQDTGRDAKRKRSLFLHKDSSNDDSPRHVEHSIFSQSDSADSEVDAPRHRPNKKSRYPPRSPHIFSDIGGTSTDGERLPASPPQPQRHVGTFSRYPVYDPRSSVRNKALLSQEEAGQAEVSQRGARGRGRGGRGRRGAASKRGAASARGAGFSRGRGGAAGRGATSSGATSRGVTSAKRGVSQSQPTGGWADRVSREERRLQSPEMLRDEPAPPVEHEHALSDAEVPPAKRRPDRDLAARFGWDSAESEGAAPPEVELSPPVPPAPSRAAPRRTSARQRRTPEQRAPEAELELSGPHEPGAELELSQPPAPPALDASAVSAAGHVSHLSVSATESAPALACPPNTPLSAGKRVAPAAPTAAQLGDAIQWQAASPQRARPPARHAAALTATQEFRLEDHLVLESEASRPVSPAPVDLSQHVTDSPLPSPIRGPGGEVANVTLPPPPPHVPQRAAAPPASSQPAGDFRPPLPPLPPVSFALERRALPAAPLSLTTDDIRAELSGMVADWDTTSVRSDQAQYHQQQAGGAAAVLQAVAAIRRQVSRLEERDERLHQLGRRSAATQETLLVQQRAAVATLERLSEAATSARRQAAERILTECERLERTASAGPVPPDHAPAPAPAAAAAGGGGVESELQSVQRELELLLQASDAQPQWYRY